MTRPEFLTTPGAWVRTRRIAQTQADYACAIERHAKQSTTTTSERLMVLLAAVFAALIYFGVI